MAKIGLTKLGLVKNTEIEILEWNDQKIEIKQYLPIEEKLNLITRIVSEALGDENFPTSSKLYIYTILETILAYTNINLTEKQKTDVAKTYDLFVSSGLSAQIFSKINPYEYEQIKSWVADLATNYFTYRNSAVGVLETMQQDYANVDLDAEKIREKLTANPESLSLLKDVLDNLG